MFAEVAYLFRHALLRDAAYELQLPGERVKLHALAFELLEGAIGERPPDPVLHFGDDARSPDLPCDPFALQLAMHARCAGDHLQNSKQRECAYLYRAADYSASKYQHRESSAHWRRLADLLNGEDRVEALRRAGFSIFASGRPEDAIGLLEQALESARQFAGRLPEGIVRMNLGNALRDANRLEEAAVQFERSIEIARALDDRKREGMGVGNLALLHKLAGRLEESANGFEFALQVGRERGDQRIEFICLLNICNLYRQLWKLKEARETLELADKLPRPDRTVEGRFIGVRALLDWQLGERKSAERHVTLTLAIAREVGDLRREGECLGHLGGLYSETGRAADAVPCFEAALALHRETGALRQEGYQSCDFALALLELGELSRARTVWRFGANILQRLRDDLELEHKREVMHEACARDGVPPFDSGEQEPETHVTG